jgi:hypothetical protein
MHQGWRRDGPLGAGWGATAVHSREVTTRNQRSLQNEMPEQEIPSCWICGDAADSAEHVFKAKDLRRIFDRDGYGFENLPFHFSDQGHARIPGPNSARVKYPTLICRRCNNERTAPADRAYDRLSDHLATSQQSGAGENLDLAQMFGSRWPDEVRLVRQYFAKSLGCRILASGAVLPDYFPNPVSGDHMELLVVSICRAQPFRSVPNYEEDMFTSFLGKGDLYANYSKSHFDHTGERKVTSAVWWENLGHFQINYWFGLCPKLEFGEAFDGSRTVYRVPAVDHDLHGIKEVMFGWLSSAGALYVGSNRLAYPMAQATWAAYLSGRTSSTATSTCSIQQDANKLGTTVEKAKPTIDTEILSYRTHGDLDRILWLVQREATALIVSAARIQGHLDGCNVTLQALSPALAIALKGSYFEATWRDINAALKTMYGSQVGDTSAALEMNGQLLEVVLRFFDILGFVVKSMPEGQCFVEIPFRSSNSTPTMALHNALLAALSNLRTRTHALLGAIGLSGPASR